MMTGQGLGMQLLGHVWQVTRLHKAVLLLDIYLFNLNMCSLSVPATDPLFYNISISRLATLFPTSLHSTFRAVICSDERPILFFITSRFHFLLLFSRHRYIPLFAPRFVRTNTHEKLECLDVRKIVLNDMNTWLFS